ncbi:unnamed protein product [Bursaphelenchus xylophilus]|uniref:(pine wood nematode) hypothetical protein n=1 Tax=Bursaphelenchus xylophilus TaxID=6326 RepID=A0A1I7SH12_BURXY|nr:unnamed protein product [Bursaphelenchus xylophilus]CAG9122989.1 unnamed protein product [Bursaphelenchus xylophilus]
MSGRENESSRQSTRSGGENASGKEDGNAPSGRSEPSLQKSSERSRRGDYSVASTQRSFSDRQNTQRVKRKVKKHKTPATQLRFVRIHGRPDVARVQLLLSNISDRSLFFKLKSNVGSNVSALPSGQGHVAARGSTRCVLTWHRPKKCHSWEEVDPPKLLLVTRFLDSNNEMTADQTSTRLLAHVARTGSCPATNPPVEQFLLDAVSRPQDVEPSEVSVRRQEMDEERSAMSEFIVSLTPEQLNLLIFLLILFFLGLYNTFANYKNSSQK